MRAALGSIKLYSHHFVVSDIHPRMREAIATFNSRLVHWGIEPIPQRYGGGMRRVPGKIYSAQNQLKTEYRFHIHHYEAFKENLLDYSILDHLYSLETEPLFDTDDVDWEMITPKTPRDYQNYYINYCLGEKPINKLISLQTGKGKGFILQNAIMKMKARLVLLIKPAYVEKWIREMMEIFHLEKGDIVVIQGGAALRAALAMDWTARDAAKMVIVSISTYHDYLKVYEEHGEAIKEMGYDCLPVDMFKHFRAKVKAIDEVHQCFHQCFKSDLYTHVKGAIGLSATLFNRDQFLMKMYNVMYPRADRPKEMELDKYVKVQALIYNFENTQKIQTSFYNSTMFSYAAVEASIFRHKQILLNFLNLIDYALEIGFDKVVREKKRCLIFAQTGVVIDRIVAHLQNRYPSKDIRRYMSDDPFENIINADICVSTYGSAGAAIDIPDLTNVIQCPWILSQQAVVQMCGRLRKLNDDHPVLMQYLVCQNIGKSFDVYRENRQLMLNRVKSMDVVPTGFIL